VGLVFQEPDRQIFSSSVQREVEFGARNAGLREADLAEAVAEALALVGLTGQERTNPYDLGPARRKLLAIASVLAMGTPIVVLDEPTTGQDPAGVARVREVVARSVEAGRTVIAVIHDLRFVAETLGRVTVLDGGRVVVDAPPARAFAAEHWDALRATGLEPPSAAVIANGLGIGPLATEADLVAALAGTA
jgi:energy-coupling factor transporter ATP-binding protein EcfA2